MAAAMKVSEIGVPIGITVSEMRDMAVDLTVRGSLVFVLSFQATFGSRARSV
jgi:hypothetical protein